MYARNVAYLLNSRQMWTLRFVCIDIFVFFQAWILAHTLNRRDLEPTVLIHWPFVFAVFWLYFIVAGLFIIATVRQGIYRLNYATKVEDGTVKRMQVVKMLDGFESREVIPPLSEAVRYRREGKTYLSDAIIDLIFIVLAIGFLVLLSNQLNRLQLAPTNALPWWLVLLPVYILFGFAFIGVIWVGLRVRAENSQQRRLDTGPCFNALFGDLDLICCTTDAVQLAYANDARIEKRVEYKADSGYHQIITAFIFTPDMAYGATDMMIGWTWFFFLIAAIIALVLISIRLIGGTGVPTLASAFIGLWAVESLMILVAFALLFSLCWYYGHAVARPRSRQNINVKYAEALFVLLFASSLIATQALLVQKIDNLEPLDWNQIFAPIFVLTGATLLTVFIIWLCGSSRRQPDGTIDADDLDLDVSSSGDTAQATAALTAALTAAAATNGRAGSQTTKEITSYWGCVTFN